MTRKVIRPTSEPCVTHAGQEARAEGQGVAHAARTSRARGSRRPRPISEPPAIEPRAVEDAGPGVGLRVGAALPVDQPAHQPARRTRASCSRAAGRRRPRRPARARPTISIRIEMNTPMSTSPHGSWRVRMPSMTRLMRRACGAGDLLRADALHAPGSGPAPASSTRYVPLGTPSTSCARAHADRSRRRARPCVSAPGSVSSGDRVAARP